eukprot:Gb_25730 [translate_table: standard]
MSGVAYTDKECRFSIGGKPIHHFFGLSTFNEYTTIHASCVVKVNPETPLDEICLLGCGVLAGEIKGFSGNKFGLGTIGLVLKARKPSWETGSSFSLKKKAIVKAESLPKPDVMGINLQINDDLEDLIDEDNLLSEEDLKKPILPTDGDYEIGSSRKDCKNYTCGWAEMEEK